MQTRRSATHKSYFRISHSAEEAASRHPQMRRIIANVFEPRDVNGLGATRQEVGKKKEKKTRLRLSRQNEALVSSSRNFSDILSSSSSSSRPTLTHYMLHNLHHGGETCSPNWEPLGIGCSVSFRWFPRQQPPLNALLPIPLSGTFPGSNQTHTHPDGHTVASAH